MWYCRWISALIVFSQSLELRKITNFFIALWFEKMTTYEVVNLQEQN